MTQKRSLSKRDKDVIWHPYTQMKTAGAFPGIIRGEGALLFDESGKTYIDAISSWWTNLHGHAHPYIAEKIHKQLITLEHVIFAGFTHEPAVLLAERLLKKLPGKQSKIFYSDNGSTAVEVAIKMAIQFWNNKGTPKTKLIAFRNAYHGDTFGSMSVSGRGAFTEPFQSLLFDCDFIDAPVPGHEHDSLEQLNNLLKKDTYAAFLYEPLIQGTAGMVMHSPEALDALILACRAHSVLCIADEVMTGFGRTGTLFASDQVSTGPDMICLSKGITGGTMAFGVTSCTLEIYNAFLDHDRMKTFFHGHSYTANPVACSASLASMDLLENMETQNNLIRITESHATFLNEIKIHPLVMATRQTGTIMALEIGSGDDDDGYFSNLRDRLYDEFIQRGVLLRPLGNIVYCMPPYCITPLQLNTIYQSIQEVLEVLWQEKVPTRV